jgi:hypothetical protein
MGTAKKWQPEDELLRDTLAQLVHEYQGSEREVARRAGIDQGRLRTILAGTRAPASVGETIRITEAVGRQASEVIRVIEHTIADYRFPQPGQDISVAIKPAAPTGGPNPDAPEVTGAGADSRL